MKLKSVFGHRRWDSSDPDRAPPPLPLNPGTSSPVTKTNTSATVAAAAEALTARARESAYITNPPPNRSPEKSLIKGAQHKRMQSLQNGRPSVRDRSSFLENPFTPEQSPERPVRTPLLEYDSRSPERSPTRNQTPTPGMRETTRDTPALRSGRPSMKAILGENTPPSPAMQALKGLPSPGPTDTALHDITANIPLGNGRGLQNFDGISSQILSLTNIATSLQREMAQLSRRSKDNATDLISLKEATNSRDEDIRKSLRDLVTNISTRMLEQKSEHRPDRIGVIPKEHNTHLLDMKPHVSPTGISKSFSLPRIPSPNSFAAQIERDLTASPYSSDGAASIALLEKILREMATKEGQDRIRSSISDLEKDKKLSSSETTIVKKLEEILQYLRDGPNGQALVAMKNQGGAGRDRAPITELDFNPQPGPLARSDQVSNTQAKAPPSLMNEDMMKLLRKLKDSIAEGGGMTAELKALVRELRGEVLGMGREIGRKLDQAESTKTQSSGRDDAQGPGREEIAMIVEEGLTQLREHMDEIMREHRRRSSSSVASHNTIENQEVILALKNAITELPSQQQLAMQRSGSGIERDEILEAVREAWETYKPEIEVQTNGLERDEILQCLTEGLRQHQSREESREIGGATYEEVIDAVREGLRHFKPPQPIETEVALTREEILMTVRECLDTFEFPTSSVGAARDVELSREDVYEAVKEGLATQAPISKEIDFNRDDLFDAVRAGLEGAPTTLDGVGEQVLDKMQELTDGMRAEFKQYSAANGGDTEQVLDALKDGLEVLRADIESYVDRAADVTGKDEIIDTVRDGLQHLKGDIEGIVAANSSERGQTDNGEILDAMEKEFEHLRQTIATSMLRSGSTSSDKDEILDALRDGIEELKTAPRPSASDSDHNSINMFRLEIERLKDALGTTMVHGSSTADKDEIIEVLRDGLEGVRADVSRHRDLVDGSSSINGDLIDVVNEKLEGLRADVEKMAQTPLDMTVNYEILDTLKQGIAELRTDNDRLRASRANFGSGGEVVVAEEGVEGIRKHELENLEVMITQLRIKVDALDDMRPSSSTSAEDSLAREGIGRVENMLRDVQTAVSEIAEREQTVQAETTTKSDFVAVETLLRNTKAQLDDLVSAEGQGFARTVHIDSVEEITKEIRDSVQEIASEAASKEDFNLLEALLKEVRLGVEELREKGEGAEPSERMTKADIETIEAICNDTKAQLSELPLPDIETLPTKSDIETLGELMSAFKDKVGEDSELTAQAFEARKIEHGGIADKIEEVKMFIEDVRGELKAKVSDSRHGIEELAKALEDISEAITNNEVSNHVKELAETVTREFETVHGVAAENKTDSESKHLSILEKHDEHKANIVSELVNKIDERFDEIMTKYDDAQLAAEAKERAVGSKDAEQAEAIKATQVATDDVRILVDTLGSTFTETCERIGEDSKTVFNRIEDMHAKVDGLLATDMISEHQNTRAEISKTMTGVEGVQAHVIEYQPKILEAVRDVLSIVGQHYEQAKSSTEEIKTSVNSIPSSIQLPAIAPLLPSPELPKELPMPEKYDDSEVHSKLDRLVEHTHNQAKADEQLELLGRIQRQIAESAEHFSTFIATQRVIVEETHQARAKEAEEAALALQQRLSQKESAETDIVTLSDQKAALTDEVRNLQAEKDSILAQKSRLQADLSSLHTALDIRREELNAMEARADGLERRILDGVLEHSRTLLTTSRPSSLNDMNLKRVASGASNATHTTSRTSMGTAVPSQTPSAVSSAVGMALKRRQTPRASGAATPGKGDRRILSLNTLGGNKGHNTNRAMVLADPSAASKTGAFGSGPLKRSHSVKSNFPSRKTSWGGTKVLGMYAPEDSIAGDEDKENSLLEEAEDEDARSDGSTERRTSYTGTYTGSLSYGDGSSITGGDYDRRTSYEPSTVGTLGTQALEEEEEEEEEEDFADESGAVEGLGVGVNDFATAKNQNVGANGTVSNASDMVVYAGDKDSGIGTDVPTAALTEDGSDYFKRGAADGGGDFGAVLRDG